MAKCLSVAAINDYHFFRNGPRNKCSHNSQRNQGEHHPTQTLFGCNIHFLIKIGSGDGRWTIEAAKRGYFAVGIDINLSSVLQSRINAREANVDCLFLQGNVQDFDLSSFDLITCYLCQEFLHEIEDLLISRMEKGNVVIGTVLYGFRKAIPYKSNDLYKINLYN